MNFKTAADRKVSISVDDPRDNITEAEIKTAMTFILSKDVFAPNGEPLATAIGTSIVETGTTAYDLVL